MGQLSFHLDLREPARRRFQVELTAAVADLRGEGGGVELFLPAWAPGSYLIREYARHLGDLRVVDLASGAELAVTKTAKNRFRIAAGTADGAVRVSYTVYAHELSVRTCDLTDRHGFLCGAAVFLWPVDAIGPRDVAVRVSLPATWQLETALPVARLGPGEFQLRAAGLDELVDSPILAGELQVLSFEVRGKPHHLVLEGLDGIPPRESLVRDTTAIIEQAAAVFGGTLPHDEYRFLCMFADSGRGGLEHLHSSAMLAPRTTFHRTKDYQDFLGLIAHEFFHLWNIKRMRPAELWTLDYETENHTELLWVVEGFTAYYDDHLCRRARLLNTGRYLEILAEAITELRRTPGRFHQSLAEASFDAWIRLYRPDENSRNSSLSYYTNGALAALCLDLRIRQQSGGARSLDDAVRALYEATWPAGRGYTHDDVVGCVSDAAGTDLTELVDSLVRRPLDPDFAAVFAPFGLKLSEKGGSSAPQLGVNFRAGTTTLSSVLEDGPADRGGLMPRDEILALNDLRVTATSFADVFDHLADPNRSLRVLVARRGRIARLEVTPVAAAAEVSISVAEDSTAGQDALRRGWLFDDRI